MEEINARKFILLKSSGLTHLFPIHPFPVPEKHWEQMGNANLKKINESKIPEFITRKILKCLNPPSLSAS